MKLRLGGSVASAGIRHLPGLFALMRAASPRDWRGLATAYGGVALVLGVLRPDRSALRRLIALLETADRRGLQVPGGRCCGGLEKYEAVFWRVQSAALAFGGLTCLPSAAASFLLLRRAGEPVTFVIGVCLDEADAVRARVAGAGRRGAL